MLSLKEVIDIIGLPVVAVFLGTALILSIITKFPQFRKFKHFIKIIRSKESHQSDKNTITPLQALFTAMSTSLGMGTIISPPLAIAIGGPGALFWLIAYALFGSILKYAEATFAVKFKRYAKDKTIIGGPTAYLWQVHPLLADWYGLLTVFLFSSWTALQAKSMAATYEHLGVPEYSTGIIMSCFVLYMLIGGAKRIGEFSSKLVPFMCGLYLTICCVIIFEDLTVLKNTIYTIFAHAFAPSAAIGGFLGATAFMAIQQGIFKAVFITEAGVGTGAIPHSLAHTNKPTDQGVLAMYSILGDLFFAMISGLVALISGVWQIGPAAKNDLPLLAFKSILPTIGPIAYTITVTLFIIGTAIGNSLNGSKSFAFFTNNRWLKVYYGFVGFCIFLGAVIEAPLLWQISEVIIPLIALPNLIGLIILTLRHRKELAE